jgi:hypothetical protein
MKAAQLMGQQDTYAKMILKCKFAKQQVRVYAYRQKGVVAGRGE